MANLTLALLLSYRGPVRILGIHNTQLPQKLLETFLLSTEGKLKDLLFLGGFCKAPLKPANAPKRQQVGNALPLYCPWGQHVWVSASCFSLAASPFARNLQTSEALAAVATLQSFHFLNKALLVTLSRGFVCYNLLHCSQKNLKPTYFISTVRKARFHDKSMKQIKLCFQIMK